MKGKVRSANMFFCCHFALFTASQFICCALCSVNVFASNMVSDSNLYYVAIRLVAEIHHRRLIASSIFVSVLPASVGFECVAFSFRSKSNTVGSSVKDPSEFRLSLNNPRSDTTSNQFQLTCFSFRALTQTHMKTIETECTIRKTNLNSIHLRHKHNHIHS